MNVPPPAAPSESVLVEVGTSAAASVRGRLSLRGARRVLDALNNVTDPVVVLNQATLAGGTRALAVVPRRQMLWARPLEREAAGTDVGVRVEKVARHVILHVGPYEIRGTVHTFQQVRWVDYVIALRDQFFPLTGARIAWPGGSIDAPFVAVNAAAITALIAMEDR